MKTVAVFVLGIVVGLAGLAIAQDKLPGKPRPPTTTPSLSPLSPEAEKALGIKKGEALVSVQAVDGSIRFLYPSGWKPAEGNADTVPMDHPVNVLALEPMSVMVFSGSPTCVWVKVGGKWVQVCK